MAGHVPKRVLRQPEVDKILLEGTTLYRWEEVRFSVVLAVCVEEVNNVVAAIKWFWLVAHVVEAVDSEPLTLSAP